MSSIAVNEVISTNRVNVQNLNKESLKTNYSNILKINIFMEKNGFSAKELQDSKTIKKYAKEQGLIVEELKDSKEEKANPEPRTIKNHAKEQGAHVKKLIKVERCRVIMLNPEGDSVAMIKRTAPDGSVHYTLPGGGIEEGETCYETIVREIREELNLERDNYNMISSKALPQTGIYKYELKGQGYVYCVFAARAWTNDIKMIGEELDRDKSKKGEYEAVWVKIEDLDKIDTKYKCAKDAFKVKSVLFDELLQ